MCCKKLVALLIGLCVLLAPVLSNASAVPPVSMAHSQDHHADCHTAAMADCDTAHDSAYGTTSQAAHGCCFNVVGIPANTHLVQPQAGSAVLVASNPALILLTRVEGLYRPPRQIS